MGDFYELLMDDARVASAAVDIVLTKRGTHRGATVPMAGIPLQSLENYLEKFVKKGFCVAVAEQVPGVPTTSASSTRQTIMDRQITRIVTPGTLVEDRLLSPRLNNYIAAVHMFENEEGGLMASLAWLDVSTGQFLHNTVTIRGLISELARINPSEIISTDCSQKRATLHPVFQDLERATRAPTVSHAPAALFELSHATAALQATFSSESIAKLSEAETAVSGALIAYVRNALRTAMPHVLAPEAFQKQTSLGIDQATRRSLELTRSVIGDHTGSLLSALDKTTTSLGARLLAQYLASPLRDQSQIEERLDRVEFFVTNPKLMNKVRTRLRNCLDIERALQRITSSARNPRDLVFVGVTLGQASQIQELLHPFLPPNIMSFDLESLKMGKEMSEKVLGAIVPQPPSSVAEGGVIQQGYSDALGTLRSRMLNHDQAILDMQYSLRQELGVASLRIRSTGTSGLFVEVTKPNIPRIRDFLERDDVDVIQQLSTGLRFKHRDLRTLENEIATVGDQIRELEEQLFKEMVDMVCMNTPIVRGAAISLARLDVATTLASLARDFEFVRPLFTDKGGGAEFAVRGGRHPVLQIRRGFQGDYLVWNDCGLTSEHPFWLVTGPNMGGKSTFLRQNALIVIMAQMGSFVPAEACELSIVDAVFSRVGAADDLVNNRSTFMVEMEETAGILAEATQSSFVIMDEVGRGTSTEDGLAIATAVVEHLRHSLHCRTLFATHYHELGEWAGILDIENHTLQVEEDENGELIFSHRIERGRSTSSFGIQVARLAGLPESVVQRAVAIRDEREAMRINLDHSSPAISPAKVKATKAKAKGAGRASGKNGKKGSE